MKLIKRYFIPCTKWLLVQIMEVFPGSNKKARVVKIKTEHGELKRAVTKIAVLYT